jgi:hypothetical protein
MTMSVRFPTWREAYDYAYAQTYSEEYRGWGWASVAKDDPHSCADLGGCDETCSHDGGWWAEIA